MRTDTSPCARALVLAMLALAVGACASSVAEVATTPRIAGAGDLDGDGVPDAQDRCVRDREDMDGYLDHDGCPDPDHACDPATSVADLGTITASLAFEPGTPTLLPESYAELSRLGASLRVAVYVERVVIVGLADASEPDPESLSSTRATRVRDYLVAHGVDGARLEILGAGLRDPLPTTPPFPAEHPRHSVWFVVERADGLTRHVLRDGVFVALEVADGASAQRRAPPPGCR